MGQFKPMVKMYTTEPSVELKLKKGGHVSMKSKKEEHGHKMMDGGVPPAPARGGMAPAAAPLRPSMAARRRAMMAMPAGAAPAAPVGMAGRMMKEGGESKAEHKAEMKKFSKLEGELKSHEGKPASKAHKGLKTGGVVNGQAGFATGGVAKAQGGYATGGVAKANAGGYKKGGAAKKAYATGGLVDSGRPVAMPQGAKKPSKPVSINQLSGTFKKGGAVKMNKGGDVPPKGVEDTIQTARNERDYKAWEKSEAESAKKASEGMGSLLSAIPRKLKEVFSPSKAASAPGSVTKTEKSVTVTPKKRGGAVTC